MKIFGIQVMGTTKMMDDITIENVGQHTSVRKQQGFGGQAQLAHGPTYTVDQVLQNQQLYEAALLFATRTCNGENLLFAKATQFNYQNKMTYLVKAFIEPRPNDIDFIEINISSNIRKAVLDAYYNRVGAGTTPNNKPLSAFNVGTAGRISRQPLDVAMAAAVRATHYMLQSDVLDKFWNSEEYKEYLQLNS